MSEIVLARGVGKSRVAKSCPEAIAGPTPATRARVSLPSNWHDKSRAYRCFLKLLLLNERRKADAVPDCMCSPCRRARLSRYNSNLCVGKSASASGCLMVPGTRLCAGSAIQ